MCKNGIYLQKYGFLFNAFSRVSKNVKKRSGFASLFQNGLQSDKYFVYLHRNCISIPKDTISRQKKV